MKDPNNITIHPFIRKYNFKSITIKKLIASIDNFIYIIILNV